MKTILQIGHQYFVLPASANINAIVSTLLKATPVEYDYVGSQKIFRPEVREPNIKITLVKDEQVQGHKHRKAIPEKAGPDADNTF